MFLSEILRTSIPVAVDEAGGFAEFRETATKTTSLGDRLCKLTLPRVADVESGLESYVETQERADVLEEKIEWTEELIDEIVYKLYGLIDEGDRHREGCGGRVAYAERRAGRPEGAPPDGRTVNVVNREQRGVSPAASGASGPAFFSDGRERVAFAIPPEASGFRGRFFKEWFASGASELDAEKGRGAGF